MGGMEGSKGRWMKSVPADFIAVSSETSPWVGLKKRLVAARGVLFLKSDFIGFQIIPAMGGMEGSKSRFMKSA
jgi:hypothetical protein